jgi:hypothetical protein
MTSLLAEYIADNNETLELLHAASKIEHCRYPVDYSAGFATLMPHLSGIRKGLFLLSLDAILHVENRRADSAVHSVLSGFGYARSLVKEPSTISQLIRVACGARSVLTLERMINRLELTDEQLSELSKCLYETERASDMSHAFIGERCMGLSFFTGAESLEAGFLDGMPPRPIIMLCRAVGLVDSDAVIYLDLFDEYLQAFRLPYHERHKAVDAVVDKLKSTSQIHIFVHSLMPAMLRVMTIETRTIAHLRAARVGLAIQRYRLTAGGLPDTLADLVPAYFDVIPTDPFDGNELRYQKRGAGFVIYSVGEDLNDDGGTERPPRKKRRGQRQPNWDITFIVER